MCSNTMSIQSAGTERKAAFGLNFHIFLFLQKKNWHWLIKLLQTQDFSVLWRVGLTKNISVGRIIRFTDWPMLSCDIARCTLGQLNTWCTTHALNRKTCFQVLLKAALYEKLCSEMCEDDMRSPAPASSAKQFLS